MTLIASTLQSFFTDRLVNQRHASPRTIASYRDSLRMLVVFVHDRTGKTPSAIDWQDLNVESISAFLDHLETGRGNGARTRDLRLTAIRSLCAYASLRHPEHAASIQQVLAIPAKRFDKPTTPCCSSRFRRAFASQNSPASTSPTSPSARAPACVASARDAGIAPCR
jgi:site-specific recombinase XerC